MMIDGWWIGAGLLLAIIIVQVVRYHRLEKRLEQERLEVAELHRKSEARKKELAEIKARRKRLLSASTQALIIVEKDYHISSANRVARQLFGRYKRKSTTFTQWTRHHELRELVDQALQGGRKKPPAIYFQMGDKWLEAHARLVRIKKEAVGVALAIHDVTELQRLSRAQRDFVANVSHELRTPLASIQLLTETLLNGALENPELALDLTHKIATQTDALRQLAQEVLDLSLIESGRMPLKMTPCSLRDLITAQMEPLLPQAERKGLSLTIELEDDFQVLVDEPMVGRVITNLLHNAIKFTDAGGVTIRAKSFKQSGEGDWMTVSVADTGPGIAPDEITRIFEQFYITDRARSHKQSGTGLGLTIARRIVQAHGGQIWAESDGHSGSTFFFTLPVEEAPP